MSKVKFFDVENGDMTYIYHNSNNFSIIDCNIPFDRSNSILSEIEMEDNNKNNNRFISTHPDEDHFHGLTDINNYINIEHFYYVNNNVIKDDNTIDFQKYKDLKNSNVGISIQRGLEKTDLNNNNGQNNSSGLFFLWPDINNKSFKQELNKINNNDSSPNNISPIIEYKAADSINMLWMGDLETDFIREIDNYINWPTDIDVLFAPHHGRKSGHIPNDILKRINPKLIILGHAESKDMNYYEGWNTILKGRSGDITFECHENIIDIWVQNVNYQKDNLINNNSKINPNDGSYYIGSIEK